MQWMRSAIPEFMSIICPLSDFLENVYTAAGKRTKRAAARIQLSAIGRSTTEDDAFDKCKQALVAQVTLTHRDVAMRLCVYIDASDLVWSGVVTQLPPGDLSKPHVDQRHHPLTFLSERFTGSQLGWYTVEKEV